MRIQSLPPPSRLAEHQRVLRDGGQGGVGVQVDGAGALHQLLEHGVGGLGLQAGPAASSPIRPTSCGCPARQSRDRSTLPGSKTAAGRSTSSSMGRDSVLATAPTSSPKTPSSRDRLPLLQCLSVPPKRTNRGHKHEAAGLLHKLHPAHIPHMSALL